MQQSNQRSDLQRLEATIDVLLIRTKSALIDGKDARR
jgi:hypothetical protein